MSLLIIYTNLKETCESCPEQWEARISDQLSLYIRYRHGRLTCDIQGHLDNWNGGKIEQWVNIYNVLIDESDPYLGIHKMIPLIASVGIMADPNCEYTLMDGNTYELRSYIKQF